MTRHSFLILLLAVTTLQVSTHEGISVNWQIERKPYSTSVTSAVILLYENLPFFGEAGRRGGGEAGRRGGGEAGTRGHRDVGLMDAGTWDSGTPGRGDAGTWDAGTRGRGDAGTWDSETRGRLDVGHGDAGTRGCDEQTTSEFLR